MGESAGIGSSVYGGSEQNRLTACLLRPSWVTERRAQHFPHTINIVEFFLIVYTILTYTLTVEDRT